MRGNILDSELKGSYSQPKQRHYPELFPHYNPNLEFLLSKKEKKVALFKKIKEVKEIKMAIFLALNTQTIEG